MEQVSIDRVIEALKMRDLEEEEIKEFLHDLFDGEEEIEDEDDFNYFDSDTMTKLKATDKGKDLIMKAPTMKKEELKKLIGEYLKGE